MNRIKRLSYEVLDAHKSKFGEDFADNKKALDQVSIIRSKGLKNKVAGYITTFIKKEIRKEKAKQLQASEVEETVEVQRLEPQQEAAPESQQEDISKPSPEPQQEAIEPAPEVAEEAAAEAAEPATETVAEPATETVAEPTTETVAEPTTETDTEESSEEKTG